MKETIHNRLETLHAEFEKGQARLQELQQQEAQLRETLLRLSGAIQVLTEMLEKETSETEKPD